MIAVVMERISDFNSMREMAWALKWADGTVLYIISQRYSMRPLDRLND